MYSFKLQIRLCSLLILFYILNFVLLIFLDENEYFLELSLYLLFNLIITCLYFSICNKSKSYMFNLAIYIPFLVIYVFKGYFQYFIGLDTFIVEISIKKIIDIKSYFQSLQMVFFAHLILVITLLFFNKLERSNESIYYKKLKINYWLIILFINLFIIITSVIMYLFDLFVMGKEAVALPFQLTGIIFYTRVIVIPLILLYLLEMFLLVGNKKLILVIFGTFLFLSLTEVFLRASKSPFFILIIYIVSLIHLIKSDGFNIKYKISNTHIFVLFILSLGLWPIIEVYRLNLITSIDLDYSSIIFENSVPFLDLFLMFYDRLLGFLQFAGLVADNNFSHDYNNIFAFENIGEYYTKYYLGYMQESHLSSPSLLGVTVILGDRFWWIFLIFFLILFYLIWMFSSFFTAFKNPIRVILTYQLINSLMAGTVDNLVSFMIMVFLVSCLLTIILRLK